MKSTIYTYTVVRSSTVDFKDKTPYIAALVDTDLGRVAALVEGYQEGMTIQIGQEVTFSHLDDKGNKVFKL